MLSYCQATPDVYAWSNRQKEGRLNSIAIFRSNRRKAMRLLVLSAMAWLAPFNLGLQARQSAEGAAPAAPPIDPKKTTRLTLGSTSGTPGTSVVVPIYFTPAEEEPVGQVKLDVNFVSKNLKYAKLDLGAAAEIGELEIVTESKDGKNDQGLETTTLSLRAAVRGGTGKPVPSGLIGYLTLNILETAVPANISLRAAAEAVKAGNAGPAGDVRAFGAQVEVLAPGTEGTVACFFFTH